MNNPWSQIEQLWSVDEVSYRICEAIDTQARMPMPHRSFPALLRAMWPSEIMQETVINANPLIGVVARVYDSNRPTRTKPAAPTPTEITRMDEAMDWLLTLVRDPKHRRGLFVSSLASKDKHGNWKRVGYRKAGRILGVSDMTVRRWRERGIDDIRKVLNQRIVMGC